MVSFGKWVLSLIQGNIPKFGSRDGVKSREPVSLVSVLVDGFGVAPLVEHER
jgi:hypothetical protein